MYFFRLIKWRVKRSNLKQIFFFLIAVCCMCQDNNVSLEFLSLLMPKQFIDQRVLITNNINVIDPLLDWQTVEKKPKSKEKPPEKVAEIHQDYFKDRKKTLAAWKQNITKQKDDLRRLHITVHLLRMVIHVFIMSTLNMEAKSAFKESGRIWSVCLIDLNFNITWF